MSEKKTGLGRGLTSLLGDISVVSELKNEGKNIKIIPVENIRPGPWQARKNFDLTDLEDLSNSIKSKGILSPILVTKSNDRNESSYDLIAGERRWRAAQIAKIHEVPCIVVNDVDANSASVMSLIENIQRKDLNAIEEAQGLNELIDQHNYTQESAGKIVGKSRVYITNSLRLLKLPEKILNLIKDNKLSAGHARLLIGREDSLEIAKIIIKDSLSVRDLEKLLKNFNQKKPSPNKIDPNIVSISKKLSDHLGLNVKIDFKQENQKSKIIINCNSLEQLNGLIEKLEK